MEVTVMKVKTVDRNRLKEISKATGKHMQFIIGELIDKEYKKVFKDVSKAQS